MEGTDDQAAKFAALLAVSLSSIKQYYDEKYDRGNFVKNVILDNILPGDIYLKARELRFNNDVNRVVLLIRISARTDISAYDIVQNLFPDKNKDFVININETDIALIKEIRAGIESKDLEKLARSIVDTLGGEFYTQATVGIGTVVEGIKDLARSFKEAQVALEVGKVFDTEKNIVSYDNLGIARGRRVALHPFLKTVVRECIPTDDKAVVDGNFYTAQTENTLSELMPRVLQALK